MRERVSTNLEWFGRVIHSYTEEIRFAAMSLIGSYPEDQREEACDILCAAIKTQIEEVDRFSGRVGDKVYENVLDFEVVSESSLKEAELAPITSLTTEYKKALMHYLSQLSDRKKLELLPSLTAGILVLIAEFNYKIESLKL